MAANTTFLGLMQDGLEVKIARLVLKNDILEIKDLQIAKIPDTELPKTPEGLFEDNVSSMDFDFDFEESLADTKPIAETRAEDQFELPTDVEEASEKKGEEERTLDMLAKEMKFEEGTLSMNLDISNITYKELQKLKKHTKKKISSEMKKVFYDEESPAVMTFGYLVKNDDKVLAISHEGKMELLENIVGINRSISKKRYHYSYIQPNEIALINALRYNHSLRSEDITAIIYIGSDYSRITLTKGYDFYLDLPIINEGYKAKDVINTVFSRLMLERSHLNLPVIHNYFLAGEGLSDSMIEFIYDRQPDSKVDFLSPQKLMEQIDYSNKYDEKTLAEFIIPIMLAVTAAVPKDTVLIRTNFLPKQLKEQQNFFSISTAGFSVLGLILITGLVSINIYFRQQIENRSIFLENTTIKSQIQVNRTVLDSIFAISGEIENIEKNIARTQALIGTKNQWHFILETISNNFNRNRLSWLTSIRNEADGFRLIGKTTNRHNIISLSQQFPESVIRHVTEEQVQGHTVWLFEIFFSMPNPLETKRMNYLRETTLRTRSNPNRFDDNIADIIDHNGNSKSD